MVYIRVLETIGLWTGNDRLPRDIEYKAKDIPIRYI